MLRVLVTGCAGFIGSHLSEALVGQGHEVIGADRFADYYPRAQKQANLSRLLDETRFSLREVDLAEADLAPLVDGVDLVYHLAGQPGVRASWGSSFEAYVRDNVLATQRLLEAAVGRSGPPVRKFVYASSSSLYGDAESFPTSEDVVPRPVSPYGVTKLAGEHLAHAYWRNHGVPTVSLRYFTVYGPRQRPDMAFHRFIRQALTGEPLMVHGDGEQTRSFTFVGDVVAANLAAGFGEAAGVALNIGGGSQASVNEVLRLIGELVSRPLDVRYGPAQPGDVRHTSADTRRAAELLGFTPRVGLQEGLAAELDWLRNAIALEGSVSSVGGVSVAAR
jgi:nucleoside-diphosphate-sugar epimerase